MTYDDWKLASPDGDACADETCTTCYLRPCQCAEIHRRSVERRRQDAADDAADAAIDDMKIEERS